MKVLIHKVICDEETNIQQIMSALTIIYVLTNRPTRLQDFIQVVLFCTLNYVPRGVFLTLSKL